MPKYLLPLFFFILIYNSNAQKQYPKNDFDAPLKIPIIFAGTFGELRSNHFHSGIDIKTQGKEGIPIYAPADGYVFRVKTKQFGYGKALYINHNNGYATVYAHLQKFKPEIQEFVKGIQYRKKRYYVNEYFKPEKFPIQKGELIGYTGDTGSSAGAHLHYEIRDSKTQNIINPMLFGLTTADNKAPKINQLMVFPLNENSRVNASDKKQLIPIKKIKNGTYKADRVLASGKIGFGINVFDKQDLAPNKNGIYSLEMNVNGKRVYYHDLETFSFSESKYLNLLIDYEHYAEHKSKIQKTHKVDANPLSIYEDLVNNGMVEITPTFNYRIEIIAKDFHGNTTTLTIPVQGIESDVTQSIKDTTNFKISKHTFSKFEKENVTIAFPKKTVYQDAYINFDVSNDTAFVHKPSIPLDRKFTLAFTLSHLDPKQRDKVYIANITNPKYSNFVSSKKKDHKIYTTTKSLGTYTLLFDEEKPTIELLNFKNEQWISANKTLEVKIKDKKSGIGNFEATIDGQWILMEYNHKKGILTYDFSDKKLVGSKHIFKIVVYDNVGNSETVSATFFKKTH